MRNYSVLTDNFLRMTVQVYKCAVTQQALPIIANYVFSKLFVTMFFHVFPDALFSGAYSELVGSCIWIFEGNCDLAVTYVIGNVPWTSYHSSPVFFRAETFTTTFRLNYTRPAEIIRDSSTVVPIAPVRQGMACHWWFPLDNCVPSPLCAYKV